MLRRSLVLVVAAVCLTGCQSKSARVTSQPGTHATTSSTTLRATSTPAVHTAPARECEAVPAAALVFDPPVIANDAPLELSRADREPRVFMGYEGPIVETYYVRFDDRQIGYGLNGRFSNSGGRFGATGNFDMYERRAITERTGVRYR